jgi:hypothetical protein
VRIAGNPRFAGRTLILAPHKLELAAQRREALKGVKTQSSAESEL